MRRLIHHPALPPAVLLVLGLVAYGPGLDRALVSEDYLILRRLLTGSFWTLVRESFTGPFLGIEFIAFYRPVAGLLLQLETLLWGTGATGYLATHLLVHVASAWLVYRLAAAWHGGAAVRWGAAFVFLLYPLHPNTVLFVASFATVFCAPFFLGALLLYERARAGGGGRTLAGALGCFALALGCYEQAIVLPALLLGREFFVGASPPTDWRQAARRWAPFVALAVAYLLVRRAALGETVGGYAGFWERLAEPARLARGFVESLVRLVYPDYGHAIPPAVLWAAAGVLALGVLAGLALWRRGGDVRLGLFAGFWVVATQAPFAFPNVVPGNGRFFYLTSVGLGLGVGLIARAAGKSPLAPLFQRGGPEGRDGGKFFAGGWGRLAAAGVLVAATVFCFALLRGYVGRYAEAGRAAEAVRASIGARLGDAREPVFLAGYPRFLDGPRGVPVAQVFHWGLADAFEPPFADRAIIVYPLLDLDDAELAPLLERPDLGSVWRYDPVTRTIATIDAPPAAARERIATRPPAGAKTLRFEPLPGARHRLVLVARGNASFWPIPAAGGRTPARAVADEDRAAPDGDPAARSSAAGGWTTAPIPERVTRSMRRLYDGAIYVWIEARDARGRLVATSRLHAV